jgi:hypothetical protein
MRFAHLTSRFEQKHPFLLPVACLLVFLCLLHRLSGTACFTARGGGGLPNHLQEHAVALVNTFLLLLHPAGVPVRGCQGPQQQQQ